MITVNDSYRYICLPFKKKCTKPNYDLTLEAIIGIFFGLLFSLPIWLIVAAVVFWLI